METVEEVLARFAGEIATFNAHRAAWLAAGHEGHWVSIRGERIEGPFRTHGQAWDAGVDRLGAPGLFMVKRIRADDRPVVIMRFRPRRTAAE